MNAISKTSFIIAILMFLCLAPMPYGYFQLVRLLAMLGFCFFAYIEFANKREILAIIFLILVVLFQPILKIHLGRELWNIVDVIVGIGLIIYGLTQAKKQEKKE